MCMSAVEPSSASVPCLPFPRFGELSSPSDRQLWSLRRMRWCAARAYDDVVSQVPAASLRLEAFLQACSDLSGLSRDQEWALAAREPSAPGWAPEVNPGRTALPA